MTLEQLVATVRACRLCEAQLQPRPVLRLSSTSRVVLIGQAPGSKVHASGVPWDDASGDHLLEWLDVPRSVFEDPERFAILPMGFCYPGRGASGDLPPPAICAATWHGDLLERLTDVRLTLLVGTYAQRHNLPNRKKTLTQTVRAFREYGPGVMPLPHPSWRSRGWMKRNPWFAQEVLPALRQAIQAALADPG